MNVSCDKTFRQLLFVIFVAKNLLTKSNSLITLTTIIRTNAKIVEKDLPENLV